MHHNQYIESSSQAIAKLSAPLPRDSTESTADADANTSRYLHLHSSCSLAGRFHGKSTDHISAQRGHSSCVNVRQSDTPFTTPSTVRVVGGILGDTQHPHHLHLSVVVGLIAILDHLLPVSTVILSNTRITECTP